MSLDVYSTDIEQFGEIDNICDIMDFNPSDVPFIPDIIWASPPCTGFSVACIGRNWVSGKVFEPKTESAELGIKLMNRTMEIIQHFQSLNPNLIWFVENPRGKMRKSPHWKEMHHTRRTVSYCKYGDSRMKPTDIWTNDFDWRPKPLCKYFKYDKNDNVIKRHCHHDESPRGTKKGGTQSLNDNHERSMIPKELCQEILSSAILPKTSRAFYSQAKLQL